MHTLVGAPSSRLPAIFILAAEPRLNAACRETGGVDKNKYADEPSIRGESFGRSGGIAMCGLAGIVALDRSHVDASELEPMLAALRHRGPDSQRLHAGGQVALGFRR